MAINLLDMLKDQISDEVFSQAGQFLGAESSGVKSAMGAALPSILGSMISGSASPSGAKGMMDMITSGGHDGSIFGNLGSLLGGGDATSGFLNSGSGILKSLMGDKLGSVVDVIASVSGMKKGVSSSIMSMAAPLVMGMVGKYVKQKALDAIGLGKFLGGQSKHVASALPAGMGDLLGFAGVPDMPNINGMGDKVEAAAESAREMATSTASGGSSLLKRVVPILLLLGVGYFGWNWFQNSKVGEMAGDAVSQVGETVGDAAATVGDKAGDLANAAGDAAASVGDKVGDAAGAVGDKVGEVAGAAGEMASNALDATTKAAREALGSIKFATGSVGEKFSGWLSSGEAGEKTFQFKNLTFATGSSAIQDMTEVNNLSAVLKAYPNVSIEVGGHTDSSGNANSNMTLSQSRADAVKTQLVAQGIAGDRISTKGYGSTMPTTANAADAANRRVEIKAMIK